MAVAVWTVDKSEVEVFNAVENQFPSIRKKLNFGQKVGDQQSFYRHSLGGTVAVVDESPRKPHRKNESCIEPGGDFADSRLLIHRLDTEKRRY